MTQILNIAILNIGLRVCVRGDNLSRPLNIDRGVAMCSSGTECRVASRGCRLSMWYSVVAQRALVRRTLVIGQHSASYARDMSAFRTEGAGVGRKLEVARLTRASLIAPALKMAT
jgi:hypothetical protein